MAPRSNPRRPTRTHAPKSERPEAREALLMQVRVRPGGTVETAYLPLFVRDDRFVLYHSRREGPVSFALLPLAGCGPATSLPPGWRSDLRAEMAAWIDTRRDHILSATGLEVAGCVPGTPQWLTP